MKTTIILPVHNGLEGTKKTVESLYKSTDTPFELLFVESESTDGTKEYIEELLKSKDNVRVVWGKKEGLPKAMNLGIQNSTGNVVITQNDVDFIRYTTDWLKDMNSAADTDYGEKPIGIIAAENSFNNRKWDDFPWVGTWFMYIPRKTIEKIGMFDENFGPGCGDDLDYTLRIIKEKLPILVQKGFRVNHRRNELEHYNDWEELKVKNMEYLKKKHDLYALWERFEISGKNGGALGADICEYLNYFYNLVLINEPKIVLELGVRNGCSTSAFVEAGKRVGTTVISVDINPCPNAEKAIESIGGLNNWVFIQHDSRTLSWVTYIDVLFIDTDHSYESTLIELRKYVPYVKKDGVILLHDTKSWPEVKVAVEEYMRENPYLTYEEYPSDFFTGLGIMKWKQ